MLRQLPRFEVSLTDMRAVVLPWIRKGVEVGKQAREARRAIIKETHEPKVPFNWPDGHVAVRLTDDDVGECVEVTIHGVRHYLHSTTARELSNRLIARLEEWNVIARAAGFPEV